VAEFASEGVTVLGRVRQNRTRSGCKARAAAGRIIVMVRLSARRRSPLARLVKRCSMHGFAITYASDTELQTSADEINPLAGARQTEVRIDGSCRFRPRPPRIGC